MTHSASGVRDTPPPSTKVEAPRGAERGGRRRGRAYVLVALALVALLLTLAGSGWRGDTQLHTLMEVVATCLALIVGLVVLVRYLAQKSNTFLLLGIGFVGTAFLDCYHALVTSEWFDQLLPSPPPSLIPWSWNASRLYLSILLLLSWVGWRREERLGRAGQISAGLVYVVVGLLTAATFLFFAFVPLPAAYYPHLPLGRPEELVSAALFGAALIGYLRKKAWREDPFEHWIVVSLIVAFFCQAFVMSLSRQLFDGMFDAAHMLKVVSYACVLTGSLQSLYRLYYASEMQATVLTRLNASLGREVQERAKAEAELRQLADGLESTVVARTAELEESRREAVRGMEQAIAARNEAEQARADAADQAARLARSNADLEQFAYVVSHDLQEPLRAITNFAQLLGRRYEGKLDQTANEFIGFMVDGARRMQGLIEDLLEFSRVGRRGKDPEPVAAEAALRDALANLRTSIEETAASITHDPLPTVSADPAQLTQLLQNLLGNAIKFHGDEPPRIHVGVEARNGTWEFTVRDNGIGIEPEYSKKIFEVFQRLHGAEAFSGNGIGLALCNRIVKRHGGRIWVESEPGHGSEFHFTLRRTGEESS